MRKVRLLIIAIASFIGTVLGEGLAKRAIALLMCGVFSFNSTACYASFGNRGEVAIAQIPRVRQQNPQSGEIPKSKPNNNSPQFIPQNPILNSPASTIQTLESESNCNDNVDGFGLYKSSNGVCIYKNLSETYVTTVDMRKSKIITLTGPIKERKNNNNIIRARNDDFFLNQAEQNITAFGQEQGLKYRAMVNGTFFQTYRTSEIYPYNRIDQDRMIPLGTRNNEKIIQEYNPDKVETQFAHRAFCFGSGNASIREDVIQAFKDSSKCSNFIGLFAATFPNEKPIAGERTLVGIRDEGSTVIFFSSNLATLKQARDTLTSFGAKSFAQLDGGSSLLLTWGKDKLLRGKRFLEGFPFYRVGIPSAIAIYSEESKPVDKPISGTTTKVADRKGKQVKGTSYGDPHLITFDGHRYSFQTVGEFILAKSSDRVFEVQTRQSPVNRSLSLNSAVAMRVGNDRVAFYSKDFPDSDTSTPLRINGKPTVVKDKSLTLPGGGSVQKQSDSNYVVQWATGEKVAVTIYSRGQFQYMDVFPFVFESQANQIVGLLGNVNGKENDDLRFRSGDILPSKSTYGDLSKLIKDISPIRLPLGQLEKVYFDQLNKDFGNSWRVTAEESLFDYPSGKSSKTFTDKAFPDAYLTLDMLSPAQLQAARSQCVNAGVQAGLLEGCVFDVGFTGYSEFAARTAQVSNILDIVESVIPGFKNPIRGILRKLPKIPGLPF